MISVAYRSALFFVLWLGLLVLLGLTWGDMTCTQ